VTSHLQSSEHVFAADVVVGTREEVVTNLALVDDASVVEAIGRVVPSGVVPSTGAVVGVISGVVPSTGAEVVVPSGVVSSTGAVVVVLAGVVPSTGTDVVVLAGVVPSTGADVVVLAGVVPSTGAVVVVLAGVVSSTGADVVVLAGVVPSAGAVVVSSILGSTVVLKAVVDVLGHSSGEGHKAQRELTLKASSSAQMQA